MSRAAIKTLSCEAIDTKPQDYDWDGKHYDIQETGEGWISWEATRCEACGKIVATQGPTNGETHSDLDSESDCHGHVPATEGPMMSYFYPLAIADEADAARKLVDLPVCVVSVNGTRGLALTGGGMDLSWEICEAFMLLGFLPPVHFADLPGMAGTDPDSKRNRWIVAGCLKSCAVSASWARDRARRIRLMVAGLKGDKAKKGGRAA